LPPDIGNKVNMGVRCEIKWQTRLILTLPYNFNVSHIGLDTVIIIIISLSGK
jgi:hypothetical protein